MADSTTDPNRMDNRPTNMRAAQGEITFGDFTLGYDAFEDIQDDELQVSTIAIMRWRMKGEQWSDDQLRKVYLAINCALQEVESSIEQQIAEAHTARKWAKTFAGDAAR